MNKILLIVLVALMFFSCDQKDKRQDLVTIETKNDSEFIIIKDTFNFSLNGRLRSVALFNGNYYCMFLSQRKNTSRSFKKMVVLDIKGDFLEDVFLPKGIQRMNYFNIEIENDSLFLQRAQFDEENFVLGKYVTDFKPTATRDFKRFEDENFNVYTRCRGEFGGTIFFENKHTQELFEGSSTCPIVVNTIDDEYYITNYMGHMMGFASVIKISDPKNLEKSDWNFRERFGSRNERGIEKLLDTMDFYIPTSFVSKKRLLHIYSNDKGTHIATIENNKMNPVYTFDFMFYPQFNQQLEYC